MYRSRDVIASEHSVDSLLLLPLTEVPVPDSDNIKTNINEL